ncbi:MAG: zinc ribbon domain-containing protein [Oscillospiraceae bacterium]|nr:zinc ribbon domain-containing protein [Oscillospiraceae bacterium]
MALFDKINELAKTAGEKTGNAIEITKLNARIGKEREHISEAKRQIGEIYYAKVAEGYELLPDAAIFADRIKEAENAIEEARAEIERIRSGENSAQDEPEAEDEPESTSVKFCPGCGSKCEAAAAFCSVCGNKF